MNAHRARAVIAIVVISAVGYGVWPLISGEGGADAQPPGQITLYGNVEVRDVELGFRVGGRIKSIALDEGQPVTAGTLLATLDPKPVEDEIRGAEAQIAVNDAALQKLIAGVRAEEIERAKAAVTEATALAEHARAVFARAQKMFSSGAATQSVLDDSRTAAQAADARLSGAEESLKLLQAGSRSEDIAAARAGLALAQARLAALQTTLADTTLYAPSDGVVITRVREPGAIVGPGEPLLVVALTRPVHVRAYVTERQLALVREGLQVVVRYDADPAKPVAGRVGFISPAAEFTPKSVETPELRADLVYRIRIVIDEPGTALRQGMPVTVEIRTVGQ